MKTTDLTKHVLRIGRVVSLNASDDTVDIRFVERFNHNIYGALHVTQGFEDYSDVVTDVPIHMTTDCGERAWSMFIPNFAPAEFWQPIFIYVACVLDEEGEYQSGHIISLFQNNNTRISDLITSGTIRRSQRLFPSHKIYLKFSDNDSNVYFWDIDEQRLGATYLSSETMPDLELVQLDGMTPFATGESYFNSLYGGRYTCSLGLGYCANSYPITDHCDVGIWVEDIYTGAGTTEAYRKLSKTLESSITREDWWDDTTASHLDSTKSFLEVWPTKLRCQDLIDSEGNTILFSEGSYTKVGSPRDDGSNANAWYTEWEYGFDDAFTKTGEGFDLPETFSLATFIRSASIEALGTYVFARGSEDGFAAYTRGPNKEHGRDTDLEEFLSSLTEFLPGWLAYLVAKPYGLDGIRFGEPSTLTEAI